MPVTLAQPERPVPATATQNDATIYAKLISAINKQAGIMGATITPQQAEQIAKTIYQPGSVSWDTGDIRNITNYADVQSVPSIVAAITGVVEKKRIKDAEDKANEYQNPTITPEISGTVNSQFRDKLGRDATPEEVAFFGRRMARGEAVAYEVGEAIKGTQEYVGIQNAKEEEKYKTEAQAAKEAYKAETEQLTDEAYTRAIPEIMSSFMKSGKLDSSGVVNAVTKWKAKLAQERSATIAGMGYDAAVRGQGYSRENYVASQGQAYQNYLRTIAPSLYNQNAALGAQAYNNYQAPLETFNRQLAAGNRSVERSYAQLDYNQQKSDYDRYFSMNREQQNQAALYGLYGSVLSGAAQGATYRLMK